MLRLSLLAFALVVGLASPAAAQIELANAPAEPKPVLDNEELLHKYVFSTLGLPGMLHATFASTLDQWQKDPSAWDNDAGGFAERWVSAFAESAIGSTTKYAVARVLHHDPSFTRCTCSGFGPRLRHALISPFTARTRTGRRVVSPAVVAGLAAENIVPAATWYPEPDGTTAGVRHAGFSVLAKMGVDVFREFIHLGK